MGPNNLQVRVISLQRNVAALYELLGETQDDRDKFWETLKGITSRAVSKIVDVEFESMEKQIESAHTVMKTLVTNAKELAENQSQAA